MDDSLSPYLPTSLSENLSPESLSLTTSLYLSQTLKPLTLKNLLYTSMTTTSSTSFTGKRSSSTAIVSVGKRLRTETPTAPVLSISAELLTTIFEGKGLEISPPLPIICEPFEFLKSLNLKSVGLELEDVL